MGAQLSGAPVFGAPHPKTAEGAEERIRLTLRFLNGRFSTYVNEAANFFALEDKRFELELAYCALVLSDINVLALRFGSVPIDIELESGTLVLLQEMSVWKRDLAHRQRMITAGSLGGLAVGIAAGAVAVAAVPAVLGAVGFTSSGVAAGSMAAGIQSSVGSIAAGSAFASAQSIGALGGVSAGAGAGMSLGAGGAGMTIGAITSASAAVKAQPEIQDNAAGTIPNGADDDQVAVFLSGAPKADPLFSWEQLQNDSNSLGNLEADLLLLSKLMLLKEKPAAQTEATCATVEEQTFVDVVVV